MSLYLNTLPEEQQAIWPVLKKIPSGFVLYGGTALALRLGHRISVDFDFFRAAPFSPDQLIQRLPFAAKPIQIEENTLSLLTEAGVKISFFGGLTLRQINRPACIDGVHLASDDDLFGTKLKVICVRAEVKDYLDVLALLNNGRDLAHGLGCARAIYQDQFNPQIALKALGYHEDVALKSLTLENRDALITAIGAVTSIPDVSAHASIG